MSVLFLKCYQRSIVIIPRSSYSRRSSSSAFCGTSRPFGYCGGGCIGKCDRSSSVYSGGKATKTF